jgi:hypothetical protein
LRIQTASNAESTKEVDVAWALGTAVGEAWTEGTIVAARITAAAEIGINEGRATLSEIMLALFHSIFGIGSDNETEELC